MSHSWSGQDGLTFAATPLFVDNSVIASGAGSALRRSGPASLTDPSCGLRDTSHDD